MTYDINTIYTKYKQLTKKQRQQLLAALRISPLQRPHYFTSSYTYLFSKKVILLSFLG